MESDVESAFVGQPLRGHSRLLLLQLVLEQKTIALAALPESQCSEFRHTGQ